jgi:hypothetical protein
MFFGTLRYKGDKYFNSTFSKGILYPNVDLSLVSRFVTHFFAPLNRRVFGVFLLFSQRLLDEFRQLRFHKWVCV